MRSGVALCSLAEPDSGRTKETTQQESGGHPQADARRRNLAGDLRLPCDKTQLRDRRCTRAMCSTAKTYLLPRPNESPRRDV